MQLIIYRFHNEHFLVPLHTQSLSHLWILAVPQTSPPSSSVHQILPARILQQVATSSPRESSQPRDQTCVSCIGRLILYHWATWKSPLFSPVNVKRRRRGRKEESKWREKKDKKERKKREEKFFKRNEERKKKKTRKQRSLNKNTFL